MNLLAQLGVGMKDTLYEFERLLIQRKRKKQTQAEMADELKVSRLVYGKMERGEIEVDVNIIAPRNINKLHPYEACMIWRRRIGLTQEDIANSINRCRYWVRLMESGEAPCQELIEYWGNKHGFHQIS